ncbi:MAG: type VI secretion system-associated FHA domain protein TagH [Rhizobiaceae bacterium]|jgi:type VI secretion system protein ImpI|nr:type VI secretion system-associated FHA domain protein TagH [Rhizobiaceae bacterium]
MTPITLTVTNVDRLPDGGPLSHVSPGRAFEIGRDTHRDWTLPDPDLFISGRHCEFSFDGQDWILVDVSRNGTYVNGARQRVKSPYRLRHGDVLTIGNYQVSVTIGAAAQRIATPAADPWGGSAPQATPQSSGDDLWGASSPGPAPADRRDFQPRKLPRADDGFLDSYLDIQPVAPQPQPSAASWGASGQTPAANPFAAPAPAASFPHGQPPVPPAFPSAFPPAPQLGAGSFASAAHGEADTVAAFKAGARLPPHALANRDAAGLASELGAIMLLVTQQMTHLMRARASTKTFIGARSRTTIEAAGNNPLKFIADPAEALDIMLSGNRQSYLDGRRAFEEAFQDLKAHEVATIAAMQKALARLLEDLSPESIESKTEKSVLANNKARAWSTFVQRWEAKTEAHENGMLDVFLIYFSEAYQEATAKSRR